MRPKTIFCDIDGTLVKHAGPDTVCNPSHNLEALAGTSAKLAEWDKKGYNIILTTGRKESLRQVTEKQLSNIGIFYDQLIMGIGGGVRVLINDLKEDSDMITAVAICLARDKGISKIEL